MIMSGWVRVQRSNTTEGMNSEGPARPVAWQKFPSRAKVFDAGAQLGRQAVWARDRTRARSARKPNEPKERRRIDGLIVSGARVGALKRTQLVT